MSEKEHTTLRQHTVVAEQSKDVVIRFTEEQMEDLGISPGDKFSVKAEGDGSVVLELFSKIDIDLDELNERAVRNILTYACEHDITVPDAISEMFTMFIESQPDLDDDSDEQVYNDGIAMLPLDLYQKIQAILSAHATLSDQASASGAEEPTVDNIVEFLKDGGVEVKHNQVFAVLQMDEESLKYKGQE